MEVFIMKPSQALLSIKAVLKGSNTPFLLGGTGIGKSAIVRAYVDDIAEDRKVVVDKINPTQKEFGFIDFRLSLYESVDLGGLPYINDANEQKRAFLGNLPVSGEGILFFDEYAQAHNSIQAICGQLLYEGRIGDYSLPKGWKVICAGNRATDRAGSNKLPSHVVGRCTMIDFEHSTDDWLAWASKNDICSDILGFISFQPELLNDFDPKITTPQPSPRSWARLSDTLKIDPPKEVLQLIVQGDIGERASIEFMSFLSLKNDVPNLQDICEGKDVEVVDSGGLCYATVCALVTVLKEVSDDKLHDYFANALDYIEKFPTPEFGIFFVRSLIGARNDVVDSARYGEFKIKNQDLEV